MLLKDMQSMFELGLGYTHPIAEAIVHQAYILAEKSHQGQTRKYSGEPYINHPVAVARSVRLYKDDPCLVAAALLHDTIEDCDLSEEHIRRYFSYGDDNPYNKFIGERIAKLVVELTNTTTPEDGDRETRKRLDLERIANISTDAKLIKLADRLDNIKTVVEDDPAFAKTYLRETLQLFDEALVPDVTASRDYVKLFYLAQDALSRRHKKLENIIWVIQADPPHDKVHGGPLHLSVYNSRYGHGPAQMWYPYIRAETLKYADYDEACKDAARRLTHPDDKSYKIVAWEKP